MARTRNPRSWTWPGGARIAVSVGLAFEDFHWSSQYVQVPRPGRVDPFSISFSDYGWRAGIWRLMDLLDEFGIKGNMSTSGLAAERHPEVVRAVAEAGHEVNAHGWANDALPDPDDPDAEREEIRRCTEVLTAAAGVRPVGWTGPGSAGNAETYRRLIEQGYIWNGDEANDDLPFVREIEGRRIVILPRTNVFHNDLVMWLAPRNPPGVIWEGFRDTFDELYAEGEGGCPKWTELTLHAHMAGRPTLVPTIRKCLRHARDHGGVWFATRAQIAEWTLSQADGFTSPLDIVR